MRPRRDDRDKQGPQAHTNDDQQGCHGGVSQELRHRCPLQMLAAKHDTEVSRVAPPVNQCEFQTETVPGGGNLIWVLS
jgi:hypothetical protein